MKTERNILIVLILNLSFSIFEFLGGFFIGSVAIISDAIHDLGDSASIGISYFFERKSKKESDETFTYGYTRYSVSGGFITTLILLMGAILMLFNSIYRIFTPVEINYNGMIAFSIIGICVNFCAALFTHEDGSLNQKAVNLHMLEDLFGWIIVLIGAFIIRFTDFVIIDPILSIIVSIFILFNALKNIKEITDILLEKVPKNQELKVIKKEIEKIEGIIDVHHIHIWRIDEENTLATMHIVTDSEPYIVKEKIRKKLRESGIGHVTLEIEKSSEHCHEKICNINTCHKHHHNHHSH